MEPKQTYVNLFSGIFFFFFLLGLVGYVSFLRTENEQEARGVLSQLVEEIPIERLQQTGIDQVFGYLEGLNVPLEAFLIVDQGTPWVFWGNQSYTTWDAQGLSLQTLSLEQERLTIQTPDGISYQAVFQLLSGREYFLISRAGFLILLGYFLLLLLGFILSQRSKKPKESLSKPSPNRTDSNFVTDHQSVITDPIDRPNQPNIDGDNGPPSIDDDSQPAGTDEPKQVEPKQERSVPLDETSKEKKPQLGDIEFLVYHRNVLDERLSGELHRAGSNQLDLSLGLIRGDKGITELELLTALREYFIYKDVLYREDQGQCWVLFPQMGLDEAVREIQRFILGVKKKMVLMEDTTVARPVPKISAGLSSRNGRILGSARLIKEAKEALKKTDKESPVIGFKSDPDQYRQFILRKNSKNY